MVSSTSSKVADDFNRCRSIFLLYTLTAVNNDILAIIIFYLCLSIRHLCLILCPL